MIKTSKKLITILMCVVMAMSMTACGKSKKSNKDSAGLTATKYKSEVKLDDYRHYTVAQSMMDISDETYKKIDFVVLSSYSDICDYTNVERNQGTVENYDMVNVDVTGKMNGEVVDCACMYDTDIAIGSGKFIDGFESGIEGKATGEEFTIDLVFPDGYSLTDESGNETDVSNQAISFDITVNYIIGMSDGFIADNSQIVNYELYSLFYNTKNITTLDEYKEVVDEGVKVQAAINGVVTELADKSQIKIDDDELQNFLDEYEAKYKQDAEDNDITFEYLLQCYGFESVDQYEEYLTQIYKNTVLMIAVVNKEGLTLTEDEYENMVNEEIYLSQGQYTDLENYEESFPKQDTVDDMLCGKAYTKLVSYLTTVPDDDAVIKPTTESEDESGETTEETTESADSEEIDETDETEATEAVSSETEESEENSDEGTEAAEE